MARSPESLARRRAYTSAWRAARPTYSAVWAKAHAGTERARKLRWKRANRDKLAEQRRRRAARLRVTAEPLPELHIGHPIFDAARAIVGPDRSGFTVLLDPLNDDLMSVAVVALLEGNDPAIAVRRFRATETAWRRVTGPLMVDWGVAA